MIKDATAKPPAAPTATSLVEIAMAIYVGNYCLYCNQAFTEYDALREAVWTGYHKDSDGHVSRISHKACWQAARSPLCHDLHRKDGAK